MTTNLDVLPADVASVLEEADRLAGEGHGLDAVELLSERCRSGLDHLAVDIRLAELRHAAFGELHAEGFDHWPVAAEGADRGGEPHIPEVTPAELSGEAVRRGMQSMGAVMVPGLFTEHVERFVEAIERALTVKAAAESADAGPSSWFRTLPLSGPEAKSLGRYWVSGAGGMLACDSPKLLQMLLDTYDRIGLRDVVSGYLGERPVLSANKCTLRRVPLTASTDWHQDGAFLGKGIRALNIWIALTDCGEDAPGMDLVPKRFDEVVETGTGGAIFDWAVGSETVARVASDAPPVRPAFKAGDAMLFDELFLHRTAIEPTMTTPRYAIESWFFAPTGYPSGQVPLVW